MYTVLLTDDEKSVIDSLKNNVPWGNLGVGTILTASDGRHALDTIGKEKIDLLITDIRMPHMDGLELLKHVRSQYPSIHCILLTAFGEFDYAMRALKLGVDDYLMKPLQIKELTEAVENAFDNVYVKKENQESLFRENIMRRWLAGNISSDELGEKTVLIDINIYLSEYCVIALRKKNASISFQAFGQECIRRFPSNLECSCVWDNSGNYLILVGGDHISRETLAETLCQVTELFSAAGLVNISVGELVSSRNNVSISYQSACTLLDQEASFAQKAVCIYSPELQQPYQGSPALDKKDLSPIVARAIKYINDNYAKGVSIKEFCAELNVSASYLGYLFKKETGLYFNTYLLEFRMSKAMELLCNSGTKINDIAAMTGYSTPNYFITSFKNKTGLSPLKYREMYGGKYL